MKSKSKILLQNYIAFSILLLIYLIVTLFLFHRQSMNYSGSYVSGFGFLTAWSTTCDNIPLALLRAAAFPLTVLVFCAVRKNCLRRLQPAWQLGIQWTVYLLHLICGLGYFRILFQGGLFH